MIRTIAVAAVSLGLGAGAAHADSSGSGALALAALVGAHSPRLTNAERGVLSALLDGRTVASYAAKKRIAVVSDSVSCRSSNVDLTLHDCTLKFGTISRALSGRAAHELYATLVENGVAGDGAAGSNYEALTALDCAIDPAAVKGKDGGGATCTWKGP